MGFAKGIIPFARRRQKNMTKAQAKDFMKTIPWKEISGLVIPQVLLMFTVLLIGLADTWVAGRISSEVQASVGVMAQVQALIMVLAMSLGSGSMAVISQSLGAKRGLRARRYILLVLYIAVIMASCFSLFGATLGGFIMSALKIPTEVQPISLYFWDVLLITLPFHYLYFVSNVLFRAAKLVKYPLFIGFLVSIINIFGNLAFGLGYFGFPAFGVAGVAWTTFGAVLTGAVSSLIVLKRANLFPPSLKLRFCWIKKASPYILKVSLPALASQALWQTGYLVLFGVTASVPNSTEALAGLSSGMRIESILFMPGAAFMATASILTGHALGEGDIKQAKRIGLTLIGIGAGIMTVFAVCMLPFMEELAVLFSPDPMVQENIIWYLIYNIMSTPFTVAGMILNGIMTGAGATIYSLVINSTSVWLIRLPLAYYLAHFQGMNARGIFLAMLLSMIYQSIAMFIIFIKRPWYNYTMRKIK